MLGRCKSIRRQALSRNRRQLSVRSGLHQNSPSYLDSPASLMVFFTWALISGCLVKLALFRSMFALEQSVPDGLLICCSILWRQRAASSFDRLDDVVAGSAASSSANRCGHHHFR